MSTYIAVHKNKCKFEHTNLQIVIKRNNLYNTYHTRNYYDFVLHVYLSDLFLLLYSCKIHKYI